jgi:hypothetical protein
MVTPSTIRQCRQDWASDGRLLGAGTGANSNFSEIGLSADPRAMGHGFKPMPMPQSTAAVSASAAAASSTSAPHMSLKPTAAAAVTQGLLGIPACACMLLLLHLVASRAADLQQQWAHMLPPCWYLPYTHSSSSSSRTAPANRTPTTAAV